MLGHIFPSSPYLTQSWSLGYDLPLTLRPWMVPPCLAALSREPVQCTAV